MVLIKKSEKEDCTRVVYKHLSILRKIGKFFRVSHIGKVEGDSATIRWFIRKQNVDFVTPHS